MGYSATSARRTSLGFIAAVSLVLIGATVMWLGQPASAAPLVGKDGKIHACYKFKGKAKGTLRVVRSAKVRCPRRWKKVAWSATGRPGNLGRRGRRGLRGRREPGVRPGWPGSPATSPSKRSKTKSANC